ncbi:MAG: TonB-dependent receptor, partial [Tsuneonella sp.]
AWRDGEVAIDREDRRTRVIGGALDYDGGSFRAALDLAWQEVRVDRLRPKVTLGTTVVPDVPAADANYAQDYTYTEMGDVFGTLNLGWDVADNAMLYARAGARDGREDGIYGGITVLDPVTGAANGNATFVPRTDNNEAIEAGLRVKLGTAITHEINFGGNLSWQVNRNAFDFLYGPGFAGFATNLYDTPQVAIPSSALVGGDLDDPFPIARTRLGSSFVSDTIGFAGDAVLITGGIRLQTIDARGYDYYNGGLLASQYREDAITPVAGIVVKPVPGLSLYANRVEGLQQGATAPLDPAVSNPGEMLAPRRSTQYEIGGKVRIGGLFASLAAYRIERPGDGLLPSGAYGYIGKQRHRGIEATVNGDLAPGLRIIAGAALNDAELIGGNEVAGVPGFTANADVEWDLTVIPGVTLTGRVMHTGKQWIDTANTTRLPDWTRFDLGARYVLAAGSVPVTLRATVDNVTNKRYWASAYDSFSAALLQGQPRTVKVSVSADF